jgi:GNAT superfamily N-acetyltransferase
VTSSIRLAPAHSHELPDIAALISEIEYYYGGEVEGDVSQRVEQLRRLLFGARPVAYVLLARAGTALAGMASYSFLWPASGDTHSLYLKELFVREPYRRLGVASALIRRLEEIARGEGCSRVEWTTDRDNPEAQKFYQALGAIQQDSKIFYRRAIN